MDHLTGWTIAVTADHRAGEQADLLQRRGADVLLTPLVAAGPVEEAATRAATAELVAKPVDTFVATSALGLRSWIAMAWTWGLGDAVLDALQDATLLARGASTLGVLVSEGLEIPRRAPAETMSEVLDRLLDEGVAGRRIGVQLHGGDLDAFVGTLRGAGAEVVPVPVYRIEPLTSGAAVDRLAGVAARAELDAITCTSAAAVRALTKIDGVVDDLRANGVVCACIGDGTASAAAAAGLTEVVVATPHRLGSMLQALGGRLAAKGRTVDVAGVELRHQGSRISVDGHEARLTPRERRVLAAMLSSEGAVLSKERLAIAAWDSEVDGHTVEVAINRLRRKLGPAALALETTNRRGYRIAR